MAFVTFENVGKVYKTGDVEVRALHNVSFEIEKGEICVVVGQSGAGKTTLLNILGGMDTLTEGHVLLDGRDISTLNEKQMATYRRFDIGFVFQFHQLLPEFTALENVMLPALIARTNRAEARRQAAGLLDFLGLSDRLSHKPAQLSGGEKQRVAVARALVNRPDVVLADEPSGSLDSQNKTELHNLFFDLRKEFGHTFVIVTHDEALARLSDRMIELCDGRITAQLKSK